MAPTEPQTWHHGLIAEWWEAFNDDFRPHEVPYYRTFVEQGQPALDAGCGSGRLLIPYLRDGIDVDGTDVSADMIAACRRKAEAEQLSPRLYVQAMHEIDLPRTYRTIIVVGSFGIGSSRERDREALQRLSTHLEPGGTLLVDTEAPYADVASWPYWTKERNASLPEPANPPTNRRPTADGREYALTSRIVDVDPLEQTLTMEMHAQRFTNGELDAEEHRTINIAMYFPIQLAAMLERAGFVDIEMHGEHQRRPPTRHDDFVVVIGRKPG